MADQQPSILSRVNGNIAKSLLTALLLVLIVGSGAFLLLNTGGGNEMTEILVPRGASGANVSALLHGEGVIKNPNVMKLLLRLSGGSYRLRAGEFRFKKPMSYLGALRVLYHDEPIVHQVTIPEGWNVRQIAEILASKKLVDPNKFISIAMHPTTPTRYQLMSPTLEGYLYPNTYTFSRVDGEEKIIDKMVSQFQSKFDAVLRLKAREIGWSIEKVVTLASIVEKETGVADERPLIASVFLNRLKKKMRLQSDPTTIYGIANFNGNLTKADLLRHTPYNTYKIAALPPGPIANPGYGSLRAVLFPSQSKYLYFVANGQGRHIFSETYADHARYVRYYQTGARTPQRTNAGKR